VLVGGSHGPRGAGRRTRAGDRTPRSRGRPSRRRTRPGGSRPGRRLVSSRRAPSRRAGRRPSACGGAVVDECRPRDALDVWPVGVAAGDDVGAGGGGDPGERRVGLVLIEVLVDPARAAVNEQGAVALADEPDFARKRAQPGLVGRRCVRLGPRERSVAEGLLGRIDVGAAAVVAVEPCAVVVVARYTRDAFGPEPSEDFVRPGGVADEVAEDVAGVDACEGDIGEDGLQRRQVGVDVGEEGDPHERTVHVQVA